MSDDRLLRELGRLAREEERAEKARLDERWDRLAAGTLTAEEEVGLRALAETSPEAGEAWEAFRPLGPEFQARVVEKIAAGLPKEEPWWRRLLRFRPTVRIGGWVTAAAAAILVVLLWPDAHLPDYQIAVTGGSSEMRGEEQPRDFAPGDRFRVVLSPPTATDTGSLEARCFLIGGGELRVLEAQSEFDSRGTVKMEGSIVPDLRPGTWTLWAVVGRPGKLPDPAELQSLVARGEIRGRNWVALSQNVRIQPRGP